MRQEATAEQSSQLTLTSVMHAVQNTIVYTRCGIPNRVIISTPVPLCTPRGQEFSEKNDPTFLKEPPSYNQFFQ
jgi:hypothetical protein